MELNNLVKTTTKSKKRLGRGNGSGKGKTAGRGYKGQKSRGKVPAAAVGGGLILYKKLPYKRGWNRSGGNKARTPKAVLVKLSNLNNLKAQTMVNVQTLVENKIVVEKKALKKGVRILAGGEITTPLTIELPVSEKVRQQVEKAGGKVIS